MHLTCDVLDASTVQHDLTWKALNALTVQLTSALCGPHGFARGRCRAKFSRHDVDELVFVDCFWHQLWR